MGYNPEQPPYGQGQPPSGPYQQPSTDYPNQPPGYSQQQYGQPQYGQQPQYSQPQYGQQQYGQQPYVQNQYGTPPMANYGEQKDWTTTLLLAIFLGGLGVHRFYTGHTVYGVIQLLTAGGCGIWWLIDILLIATNSYTDSNGMPLRRS